MEAMPAGVVKASESLEGTVWDILGQTYKPKQLSETCFSFDTLFPPGTFVPFHIHPEQDEFIQVFEGRFSLWVDGVESEAGPGDLVCLPMGCKHAIFNRTDADARALFWVTPSARLYDLFTRLDGMTDKDEVVRVSAEHDIHFYPPPA